MPVTMEILDGGVGLVTLSPEASRNTFSKQNFTAILATLDELLTNEKCSSVVLTGSGRFFSVGGNIDDFSTGIEKGNIGQVVKEMTEKLHPLLQKIRTSETIFICAINGSAAGGGLGLALSCDYRICTPDAKLASAFFRLGLSPDGVMTWLLPRLVGNQEAKRFFFNSEIWSAEKSLKLGAVDEIIEEEGLIERAVEIARLWGGWSENSRRGTKQLLDASTSTFFETQLQFEQSLIISSSMSEDFEEGVRAFYQNREPLFRKSEEE